MYYKNSQEEVWHTKLSSTTPPYQKMGSRSTSSEIICKGEPNANFRTQPYRKHSSSGPDSGGDEPDSEELNTTHLFHLNRSAEQNADGSLKYNTNKKLLPLTPVPKRKWEAEVPPLDLAALRGSMESSNSFKPYTATVRSTDTYRPADNRHMTLNTLSESHNDSAF